MDTLTNAAKGVTGAIWGTSSNDQSGTEPVSGQMGDTKKGEPYDAGNADSPQNEPHKPNNTGSSSSTGNTPSTGPIRPEHENDKTGMTSAHQPSSKPTSSAKPSSSNARSGKGPEPSVGVDPSSAPQDTQKHQGADRPHEAPEDSKGSNDAIEKAKKEAKDADNIDTSGPGPRPLEEVAKQGGSGDTGGNEGGGDDDDNGPQKESYGEGTGEKYVKSSGMKADGGDFDATNAGAGKEADRLLEQKGIHHEAGATGPPQGQEEGGQSRGGKEKKGLLTKIKSKISKKGDKD